MKLCNFAKISLHKNSFVLQDCEHYGDNHHISPVDDSNIRVIALQDFKSNFLFGAVWDSKSQSAYATDFVSLPDVNSIFRYDYNTQIFYAATISGEISPSFIWPIEGCNDEFVAGLDGVIKLIRWNGVSPTATVIRTVLTAYGHMNYFLADRAGRLFFGTLNNTLFCAANNDYAFYRYSKGSVTKLIGGLKTTTGLAIDYNRNKFYHADACSYEISKFDYDPKTGDICKYRAFQFLNKKIKRIFFKGNGRVVFDFKNAGVTPYPYNLGLKVDTAGRLYCTLYETGQMWIIDPKYVIVNGVIYRFFSFANKF